MKQRKLGSSGLEVSAMGLGCMRMSFGDKPTDKQEMIDFLHKAVEPFKGKVVIATKFGWKHGEKGPHPVHGMDSRPDQIKRVADASLRRLRVDVIDLFYQQRPDPNVPMEAV